MPSEIESQGKIEAVFSFDRVRINTHFTKAELRKLFPSSELKPLCKSHRIRDASSEARKCGFRSTIEVVVPQGELLKILRIMRVGENYKISHIEIAMDIPCKDEFESKRLSYSLNEVVVKKYTHEHVIYDGSAKVMTSAERKKAFKDGKYGEKTGYWGVKRFGFKIYSRISKIMKLPCCHMEWAIQGAATIKSKTGISSVEDMLNFDIEKWFNKTFDKYIELRDIDHLAHGRFVQDMKRGRKEAYGLSEGKLRKLANPKLASILFCKVQGIDSVAGLREYYKVEQKRIRRKKTKKSLWEERVLGLSDHKIQSFTRPIK